MTSLTNHALQKKTFCPGLWQIGRLNFPIDLNILNAFPQTKQKLNTFEDLEVNLFASKKKMTFDMFSSFAHFCMLEFSVCSDFM